MKNLVTHIIITWLAFTPSVYAAVEKYVFDTKHTQILFFVNHLGFSNSQGEFHDYDGNFSFDQNDWMKSKVEIDIRTRSIDMDDHAWDKHMRDKDFFNVTKYPTMHFKSTRVEQINNKKGKLHGELTLLGITRPVSLDFTFNKSGVHPKSKKFVAGFSATTIIKRSEFGMNYGIPAVSDEVQIRLEVEGIRQ
ncbi:MAG: polyisoprenoid-binding protein [Gammaproteobacteria bacterium]|nr:MAG: polyisoprenoid-binding protein [Gammaproteobacteria bacterium]